MEADAGLGYLATAYAVFFAVLFGYVLRLRGRDRQLREQLEQLAGDGDENKQ